MSKGRLAGRLARLYAAEVRITIVILALLAVATVISACRAEIVSALDFGFSVQNERVAGQHPEPTPPLESDDDARPQLTFNVTNTNNSGAGSLRQAITDANAAGGADTINITATGTINLSSVLPTITGPVTINGPAASSLNIRRSTGGNYRVLEFAGGQTSSISGVTVSNGNVTGDGGGIFNSGTLTIRNATISGNTATGFGGGIENTGSLNLVQSTVSGNSTATGQSGGGIDNTGTLTIMNSTISGNSATSNDTGGGIFSFGGTASIVNSTITNNQSNAAGGAGGMRAESGAIVTIKNSIVAANQSNQTVPDVAAVAGGSIVSNGFNLIGNRGTVTFGGQSDQSGTGGSVLNPGMVALANNGGPTQTHALLNGSPAMDKGSNAGSGVSTDQRGLARTVNVSLPNATGGDGTDIGAFEAATIPVCTQTLTPIAFGQTLNGSLQGGDCMLFDSSLYDRFTFSGTAGQQIAISMNSAALDSYLILFAGTTGNYDGSGPALSIAEDNNGGGGQNARIPGGSGFFTLPQTGTYLILTTTFPGSTGAYALTLTLGDTTAPTATPATAASVTTAGGTSHNVTVQYNDNVAISTGTLGTGDIMVTGPNGFNATPGLVNIVAGGNPGVRTGNYSFTPPGGSWDAADNGTYNIVMQANQVSDTSGNFVAAGTIGTFTVNIPASPQTFTVTNLNDSGPGSLRQAILNANANSPTADTINFQAGLTGTISLTSGTLTISDSATINGPGANVLTVSGASNGANRSFFFNSGITVNLSGLTISGANVPGQAGGGIASLGTSNISNVALVNNTGSFGGGIVNSGGIMTVTNCTLAGNTATDPSGGAGINNQNFGTLTVTNSTISGNTSMGVGGGITVIDGTATVLTSTITGNTASHSSGGGGIFTQTPVILKNSIVANNTASVGVNIAGTVSSQGYNLIGNASGATITGTTTGNQLNVNPLLGPLGNNGGPTQTHALRAGSPAIDKGGSAPGVTTDQRGFTRVVELPAIPNAPAGNGIDIGAFEVQGEAIPPTADVIDVTPDPRPDAVTSVNIVFSEAVSGFDRADITLTRNGGPNLIHGGLILTTSDNITYNLGILSLITGDGGNYVLTVNAAGSGIIDAVGNPLAGDASDSWFNSTPIPPATFTVTNLNDSGAGSLRQAIFDANANTPAADTINFQVGLTGTIALTTGELSITDGVTINGPGANLLTVSGNNASRVLDAVSGQISIRGLTITRGNGAGSRVPQSGGAILCSTAVTIDSTHISDSISVLGGGIHAFTGAQLTVSNSTVSGNRAFLQGGGLNLHDSSLTLINSTISGNRADASMGPPGALFLAAFSGNGTLQIVNSTIANNITGTPGTPGGIVVVAPPGFAASAQLRNSIIAQNGTGSNLFTAASPGGIATITSQGFNLASDNGNGFLTGSGDQINTNPMLGPLQNNGGPTPTHALLGGSPALDNGDNSVPVPTFCSMDGDCPAGSFCVDGQCVPRLPPLSTDQRGPGFLRVVDLLVPNASGGDGADIGAFELQAEPPPVTATISGRVLRPSGSVLPNTRVNLIDPQGVVRVATSSSFGEYLFTNLPTGQVYLITVSSKRFRFAPQNVTLNGNVTGLNLQGLE